MIARKALKPFAAIGQTVLPDSRGMKPKLLLAIVQARKASLELSDKLYILENLLEEAMD
jgi:hypothetical protein